MPSRNSGRKRSKASYRGFLLLARRFIKDSFSAERGYDFRKFSTWSSYRKKRLRKYAEFLQIMSKETSGRWIIRPRTKAGLRELHRYTRLPPWVRGLKVGFLRLPIKPARYRFIRRTVKVINGVTMGRAHWYKEPLMVIDDIEGNTYTIFLFDNEELLGGSDEAVERSLEVLGEQHRYILLTGQFEEHKHMETLEMAQRSIMETISRYEGVLDYEGEVKKSSLLGWVKGIMGIVYSDYEVSDEIVSYLENGLEVFKTSDPDF